MNTPEQLAWAKNELKEAMDGSFKTRYKALLEKPDVLLQVEEALLFVAKAKKASYDKAFLGQVTSSDGWINHHPELASQILILQQNMVSTSEISFFHD